MRRIFVVLTCCACLVAGAAHAVEIKAIAVVEQGTISAKGTYLAYSGPANPAFENQAKYSFFGSGNVGFAQQDIYQGAIGSQQQLQVESGFGRFASKVGTSTLITTTEEQSVEPNVTLVENAIGFGGNLMIGMATVGFNTARDNGFMGIGEAQGIGTFRAGAAGQIMTGGATPIIVERSDFRAVVGPGQIQAQFSFTFPRMATGGQ